MHNKPKFLIVVLLILNLSLLLSVLNNNKRVSYYKKELETIITRFYDVTGNGKLLNVTTHLYRPIYVDKNIVQNKAPFRLLAIFDDKGCSVCVEETIQHLNKFNIKYPGKLKAIFVGKEISYLEKFDCKFPIVNISEATNVFSSEFNIPLPSVMLIDQNNLIHSVYRAELHVISKQTTYFKKVEYLLMNIK